MSKDLPCIEHTVNEIMYILECAYCNEKVYAHNYMNDRLCHKAFEEHNRVCVVKNLNV